jgi:hypothetical protein
MSLTFNVLRWANNWRMGLLKNKHGNPTHSKPDGSDWSPGQWLRAVVGELGELAEVRMLYESGVIARDEYNVKVRKELADVQIYLDLFARRCLDSTVTSITKPQDMDPAQLLMMVAAHLGTYANDHKKFDRGEMSETELYRRGSMSLGEAEAWIHNLIDQPLGRPHYAVRYADPHGVDLGEAVIMKFNEVSRRMKADVFLTTDGQATIEDPAT